MLDLETLNSTPRWKIPELCKDKFCEIYKQKWGETPTAFYEQQKALFISEVNGGSYAQSLQKASAFSVMNAFLFLAIFNLSLEKCSSTTCYLECRSQKTGKKDANGRDVYASIATISVTGYGEILLRQRAGQIKSADSPVVIYDCDSVEFGERDGHKYLDYKKAFPTPTGAKIIGCYVRIVKNDGTPDYFLMDMNEIIRLKNYSTRFNGGRYTNALYGEEADSADIDTGFLKAKTIKHAFKGYPRLELTTGGAMESDKDETQQQVQVQEQPNNAPSPEVASAGVQVEQPTDTPFD